MDIRINIKHLIALLILLTSSIGYSQSTTTTDINSLSFPQLSIKNDTVGIQISSMHVAIKTMGNIAISSYDITFYNPSMRLLEGELNFPLKANQQIVDFSMDVNGQLRKGVVVEKNKGQRVFESILREGIDPGLLEKTKGNNFRLRIYPIMAQSSKRIIITCQEEMVMNNSSYQYLLPMDFDQLIDQFSVEMEVMKGIKKPNILKDELADIRFKKWNDSYIAQASMKKFKAKGLLSVQLPVPKKQILKLSSDDGRYFYATMPLNIDPQKKNRIEHLDIVWDISGSGIKRNIQKELDLLSAYLKKQGDSNVTLTTFNHICDASKHFKIRDGQVATLINHLKALHYDGGSRINNINFNQFKGQEILLFTDGLTTLGDLEINLATKPVNIINSSLSANHLLLQQLAQKNQGNYIDLSTLDNPTALNMLDEQVIHVNCEALNGQLNEVITQISPDKKMLLVTGKKQTAQATVAINVLQGNQVLNRQSILIENQEIQHAFPVNRLWASQKIKRLMANKKRNKPEIIAIAKKYGVVTDYTSLLVLERLEDYIRFEVEPPVEWMAEYQQAIDQKHKQYRTDSDNNNAFLQAYIREYKKWWNTNYPLTKKPPFGFRKETMEEEIVPITRQQETAPPPPPAVSSTLNIVDDDIVMEELAIEDTEMDEDCEIDFTDLSMNEEDRNDFPPRRRNRFNISLNASPWDSAATYMASISHKNKDEAYPYYLSIKTDYAQQPSFFLDIASYLFKIEQKEEALAVLTNITELKLENAELLRMVGKKLVQQDYLELAILIYRHIMELRPEELQSYRDLALALEKAGELTEAAHLMNEALTTKDLRNNGPIKGIILNELNCLLNKNPKLQNEIQFNKDCRYNMPVSIRIVLSWSKDQSDVDLWVTEPSMEKCYYKNTGTWLGGRISGDITDGYGPEEYSIKVSQPGTYKIQANYFGDRNPSLTGPITLTAEIFKNYGNKKQSSELIVLQLKEVKQIIDLGELVIE